MITTFEPERIVGIPPLGRRIDTEIASLASGGTLRWVFLVVIVVAATAAFFALLRFAVRTARSIVDDPRHRVNRIAAWVGLAWTISALWVVLRPLLLRAPFLVSVVLVVLVFGFSWVARGIVHDLATGFAMMQRRRFTEGDVLEWSDSRVRVLEMGILSTLTRSDDGSRSWIPNREFAARSITLATTGGAARIRLEVPVGGRIDPETLVRLRHQLLASVYRLPGGTVAVSGKDPGCVSVELETWAAEQRTEIGERVQRQVQDWIQQEETPS